MNEDKIFEHQNRKYNIKVDVYEGNNNLNVYLYDIDTKEKIEITLDGADKIFPPPPTPCCVITDPEKKEVINKFLEKKILYYCNFCFAEFNLRELYQYDKEGTKKFLEQNVKVIGDFEHKKIDSIFAREKDSSFMNFCLGVNLYDEYFEVFPSFDNEEYYNFCEKIIREEFIESEEYRDSCNTGELENNLKGWIEKNNYKIEDIFEEYTNTKIPNRHFNNDLTILKKEFVKKDLIALVRKQINGQLEYFVAIDCFLDNNNLKYRYAIDCEKNLEKAIDDYYKLIAGEIVLNLHEDNEIKLMVQDDDIDEIIKGSEDDYEL